MKVGILGAGAIACGSIACLAQAGHESIMWSPSGQRTRSFSDGAHLVVSGALSGSFPVRVADNCAQAVAEADVVMLALPAYGHKTVLDAAAPHIRPGQAVIISSHLSFAALYLSKLLATRGISAPIVAWGTTVSTGKPSSPTGVHIGSVRQKVDIATLPEDASEQGHALCTALFGDRFVQRDGLLAIALSNVNPQNHLGIALLNLTRMELGETWSQTGNVTTAVGQLIEALDQERLAIANAFGLKVRTVQEHFALTYGVPVGSVAQLHQDRFRQGLGAWGPKTLDTRYVTEDVPFGLLPTVALGSLAGTDTTLHKAGIALFSAAYGRDFSQENNILPALGLDALSPSQLERITRSGFRPC